MPRPGGDTPFREREQEDMISVEDREGAAMDTSQGNELNNVMGGGATGGRASRGGEGGEGPWADDHGAADPRSFEVVRQGRSPTQMSSARQKAKTPAKGALQKYGFRPRDAGLRSVGPRKQFDTPGPRQPGNDNGLNTGGYRRHRLLQGQGRVSKKAGRMAQAGPSMGGAGGVGGRRMGIHPAIQTDEGGGIIHSDNDQAIPEQEVSTLPPPLTDAITTFAHNSPTVSRSLRGQPFLGTARQHQPVYPSGNPMFFSSAVGHHTGDEQQAHAHPGMRHAAWGGGVPQSRRGGQGVGGLFNQRLIGSGMQQRSDDEVHGSDGTKGVLDRPYWRGARGGAGEASGRRGEGRSAQYPPPSAQAPRQSRNDTSGNEEEEDGEDEEDEESESEDGSVPGQAAGAGKKGKEEEKMGDVNDPESLAWRLHNTVLVPSMLLEEILEHTLFPWKDVVGLNKVSRLVDVSTALDSKSYAIHRELGSGSFGTVYEVQKIHSVDSVKRDGDLRFRPRIGKEEPLRALKVIDMLGKKGRKKRENGRAPPRFNMACEEIQVMRQISGKHPNLLTLIETFVIEPEGQRTWPSEVCLVLELGKMTLETAAVKYDLTIDHLRSYTYQVASALAYLHSNGFAHLDIKQENVLCMAGNVVKVGDFGLCWHADQGPEAPRGRGTSSCAPPEFHLDLPLDHKADVWSYGVMVFESLTHSMPFKVGKGWKSMAKLQAKCVGLPASDEVWEEGMAELRGLNGFNEGNYTFDDGPDTLFESLRKKWKITDVKLLELFAKTWKFAPSQRGSMDDIMGLEWFQWQNPLTGERELAPEVLHPSLLAELVPRAAHAAKPPRPDSSPFLRTRSYTETHDDEQGQGSEGVRDSLSLSEDAPDEPEESPVQLAPPPPLAQARSNKCSLALSEDEMVEELASAHGHAEGDGDGLRQARVQPAIAPQSPHGISGGDSNGARGLEQPAPISASDEKPCVGVQEVPGGKLSHQAAQRGEILDMPYQGSKAVTRVLNARQQPGGSTAVQERTGPGFSDIWRSYAGVPAADLVAHGISVDDARDFTSVQDDRKPPAMPLEGEGGGVRLKRQLGATVAYGTEAPLSRSGAGSPNALERDNSDACDSGAVQMRGEVRDFSTGPKRRRVQQGAPMAHTLVYAQAAAPSSTEMASTSYAYGASSASHVPPSSEPGTGANSRRSSRGINAANTGSRQLLIFGGAGEAVASAIAASIAVTAPSSKAATGAGKRKRSEEGANSTSRESPSTPTLLGNAVARPVFTFGQAHEALAAAAHSAPPSALQGGGEAAEADGQAHKKFKTHGMGNGDVPFQQVWAAGPNEHNAKELSALTAGEYDEL